MDPLPAWIAAAVATALTSYLSLINGALRYYSLAKFERRRAQDQRRLALVRRLLDDEQNLVIALTSLRGIAQTAGVVAMTGALIAATRQAHAPGGVDALGWLACGAEAVALGTALFVAVGWTLPHAIGERRAEDVLLRLLPTVNALRVLTRPVLWVFAALHRFALRVANVGEADEEADIKAEILSAALAGQSEGVIDAQTRDVIERLIEFRDVAVTEVMTQRRDVVSIEAKDDLETMLRKAREHEFSRLPVTDGSLDKIVGVLVVKDLLRAIGHPEVDPRTLFRQPIFVPETKKVADLLKELRTKKLHMAIVADEYGGTAGLVTIEDLIEEIIGEIDDEHDQKDTSQPLKRLADSELDIDARLSIVELNERTSLRLPEDGQVDTLGGYLAMRLGRIPAKGDRITFNGHAFTVTDADERRARRVHVKAAKTT